MEDQPAIRLTFSLGRRLNRNFAAGACGTPLGLLDAVDSSAHGIAGTLAWRIGGC
jgi:hypothetical protein